MPSWPKSCLFDLLRISLPSTAGSDDEEDAQMEAIEKDPTIVSAEVSDMDYLKSRMTKVLADDKDGEDAAPATADQQGEVSHFSSQATKRPTCLTYAWDCGICLAVIHPEYATGQHFTEPVLWEPRCCCRETSSNWSVLRECN